MKRNYAIIDHIGSMNKEERDYVYAVANNHAEKDGFQPKPWKKNQDVFTLKTVAQDYSPYARTVTSAMKNKARNEKEPKKVYLVCEQITDTVEWNEEKWASRKRKIFTEEGEDTYYLAWIQTEIIEANPKTYTYAAYEISKARMEAIIWSSAIGWEFSKPLIRENNLSAPDIYIRNHHYDKYFPNNTSLEVKTINYKDKTTKLPYDSFYTFNDTIDERFNERQTILKQFENVESVIKNPITKEIIKTIPIKYNIERRSFKDYSTASKVSTKPSTFRENNLEIASEKECKDFQIHLHWLLGEDLVTFGNGKPIEDENGNLQFKKNNKRENMIEDFLSENYTLCPNCGMPVMNSPSNINVLETYEERLEKDGMAQCSHCDTWIPVTMLSTERYFEKDNEALNSYEFSDREHEENEEEE